MRATAELQIIPIGEGVSVRKEVTRAVELLKDFNLIIEPHSAGTDIEGELADILRAVEQVHQKLHKEGSVRLVSNLKLETRTDKEPTLKGKRL